MPDPVPSVGRRRSIATVALAAAVFIVVSLAATSGPVPFAVEGSGGWWLSSSQGQDDTSEPIGAPAEDAPVDEATNALLEEVVSTVTQVLLVILLTMFAFLLIRGLMAAIAAGRRTSAPRSSPMPAHEAPPSGPERLGEAVDDGLATLAAGPVDDVVVACWVRLEEAAAGGGVARHPSETPAELTVRMLTSFDVPDAAVERLLTLYRAARYSRHRLGEQDRAAAIAALAEIRAAIAGVPA